MLQICSHDVYGVVEYQCLHLVIAGSRVEDAKAAINDTCDNLMSRVPLGLTPCLCHQLVCRLVSACSS